MSRIIYSELYREIKRLFYSWYSLTIVTTYPQFKKQVVVDHNKRVLNCSQVFLGATPDKTICKNDLFSLAALNGSLQQIEYQLYDTSGELYTCQGGYIIVDGGYIDSPVFIDPDKFRLNKEAVLWSEWLESVRKDVENFFGILKQRFRFFRNGISYHDKDEIEQAFKTCCCLNNMILIRNKITYATNVHYFKFAFEMFNLSRHTTN